MGFIESVRICFRKYADFGGRARRSEYWWWVLFQFIVAMVLYLVVAVMMAIAFVPAASQADADGSIPGDAFGVAFWVPMVLGWGLYTVVLFGMLLPGLAVVVRRLHDTGRSGWWYWISLVPGGSIVLLVFSFQDSVPGANQYGPNPKGVAAAWQPMPYGTPYAVAPYGSASAAQYPAPPAQYPGQPAQYPGQPAQYPAPPALYPGQPAQYPEQPEVEAQEPPR